MKMTEPLDSTLHLTINSNTGENTRQCIRKHVQTLHFRLRSVKFTNSIKLNRCCEAGGRSAGQEILRFFPLQNEKSLEGSQQRTTIAYPEPAESTPHPHAPLHNIKTHFNIIIPTPRFVYNLQVSRVVISIGVHFPISPCVMSDLPFSTYF
jgi:hypothetical protein